MTPPETIAWAKEQDAAGKKDAFGYSFTSWLIARRHPDGTVMRDEKGDQVFETHAEYESRQVMTTNTTHHPRNAAHQPNLFN